ncbi:MAG: GNAT family N-acetyltransferase [Desulfobacteraceae bacterium]|nr:MAG: GNAT family N-acetyltransferase [Desulfobacteraceae bacterium]
MPTMTFFIRRASIKDSALLSEIGTYMFNDTFGPENTPEDMESYLNSAFAPEQIASALADPTTIFLLAYEDNEPIGYATLKVSAAPKCVQGPKPMELARLYVNQRVIGKGYGAALLKACQEEALDAGYETIWLGVWERNERAIRFYEKWGFREAGTHAFILGNDVQNDLIMEYSVKGTV